jgi:hypothetical protein
MVVAVYVASRVSMGVSRDFGAAIFARVMTVSAR